MIQLNLLFKLELRAKLLYFIVLLWIVIRLASIKNQFMWSACKLLRYSSSYRDGRFITTIFLNFPYVWNINQRSFKLWQSGWERKNGKERSIRKELDFHGYKILLMTNTSSTKMHNFFDWSLVKYIANAKYRVYHVAAQRLRNFSSSARWKMSHERP